MNGAMAQTAVGDNKDMESVLNNGSGFDYMRMFIHMQECGTDEFASNSVIDFTTPCPART